MKRTLLVLLLVPLALPACQTAHRAAVSTFRVIDAPHEYLRRQLDVDENDADRRTRRTTVTTETNVPPPDSTYPQPFQQEAPPPYPPQQAVTEPPPPRQVVTRTETNRVTEPEEIPPAPPRVTSRTTTTNSSQTREIQPKTTEKAGFPYAKPVPGKPGYVFSPYDKNGGYVDVTGFSPGSKVKDPYSGNVFLVP